MWQRADVREALRDRDIGRLFVLLHRYTGVSQTRLAIACDTTQPKISGYMRGTAKVEELGGLRADRGRAEHARPRPHRPRPGSEGRHHESGRPTGRAGYPATGYPSGLASPRCIRSAQRRCRRQRGR
jgi:hypothetical protein